MLCGTVSLFGAQKKACKIRGRDIDDGRRCDWTSIVSFEDCNVLSSSRNDGVGGLFIFMTRSCVDFFCVDRSDLAKPCLEV